MNNPRSFVSVLFVSSLLALANTAPAAEQCSRREQGERCASTAPRSTPSREPAASKPSEKKGRLLDALRKAGSQPVDLHQAQLTQADSGQRKSVPLGQPIYIRLSGNPATGCEWRLAELQGDALRQEGEPVYYPRPEKRGAAEASGAYVWTFRAAKLGKASVKLVYVRPGEKKQKPLNLFTATIQVVPERSAASGSSSPGPSPAGADPRGSKAAASRASSGGRTAARQDAARE